MGQNYMGKVELVSAGSPQALTDSYVALGDVISIPGVNQLWARLVYTAGSEADGISLKGRWLKSHDGEIYQRDLVFSDNGTALEGRERIWTLPKAEVGAFDLPILPNGRKYLQLYVTAEGELGEAPGTIHGDVEFYLV